jgi:hypothetical protein
MAAIFGEVSRLFVWLTSSETEEEFVAEISAL